jgi:reactive intermediate/imine deaminase
VSTRLLLSTSALALVLGACGGSPPVAPAPATPTSAPAPSLEHVNMSANWPYPFSSAVRAGDMIYVSGQIGTRDDGAGPKLVPGGIDAETRQTLENVKAILVKSGSSLDRVVSCIVMMADMSEWPAMNKVYAEFFPGPKPARGAFGASALAMGARVEIMCTAMR